MATPQFQSTGTEAGDIAAGVISGGVYNPNIDVSKIKPAVPLGITNPPTGPDLAGAIVAGAGSFVKSYTDSLAQLPKTDTAIKADALNTDVTNLLATDTGRGAAQTAAEAAQGVPGYNKQLADINAQILSKTAEYNALNTSIEGKPITMNSIIGGEAQVNKAKASEIGLLQALALGVQGQLSAAQNAADRAVDLKYQDIESQIKVKQDQLALIKPTLDKEQKDRADALDLYYTQQKQDIADKKAEAKTFQTAKIQGLSNSMPTALAQQAQQLFDNGQTDQAYAIMSKYTGTKNYDTTTPTTVASETLTKPQKVALKAAGLNDSVTNDITTALLGGATLESIRQALIKDKMDPKILDTYDNIVSIQGLLSKGRTQFKDTADTNLF